MVAGKIEETTRKIPEVTWVKGAVQKVAFQLFAEHCFVLTMAVIASC